MPRPRSALKQPRMSFATSAPGSAFQRGHFGTGRAKDFRRLANAAPGRSRWRHDTIVIHHRDPKSCDFDLAEITERNGRKRIDAVTSVDQLKRKREVFDRASRAPHRNASRRRR